MRQKALLCFLIPLAALTGSAAQVNAPAPDSATIAFAAAGNREVWIQPAPTTGPTSDTVKPAGPTVEISLAGKNPTDTVYMWDHKTGNMAISTVAALKKALNLVVGDDAFKDLGLVKVRLEHLGQPVAAAEVTTDDGRHPLTQLLDPSTKGELSFYDLKPGSLKVTAKFKVKDGSTKSVTQIVDAALGHGDPSAIATVSIADDVATIAPAVTPATPTNSPNTVASTGSTGNSANNTNAGVGKKSDNAPNTGGVAFGYLIALGIAAGAIYLAYRYAKQNPDAVQAHLKSLGVDVPKPGDDAHQFDAAMAPAPRRPDPPQKIILSDAAPDPIVPMAASNVVTGEPRLVSEAGDAMILAGGETVVGRDVGLGLSLVGETTVSRRHAQLVRNGNEVTLTDLGSTNKTYVNGVALTSPQTLRPGDAVQFGAVRFRFEA